MVYEYDKGEDCDYTGTECLDDNACNTGDNADCIYPANNYDCCGECAAQVDCFGVCGGGAGVLQVVVVVEKPLVTLLKTQKAIMVL